MKTILAIIKMSRPINSLITFVTVFVAALICNTRQSIDITVFYASLSAMLVAAAGNIINDIFDYEIDKVNRPNRILPSEELTKKSAIVFYLIFTTLALMISSLVNNTAVVIVTVTSLLLFFYSYKLKGIPLIGNLTVAVCTGLAFIYGGLAVGNWKLGVLPAVFAFLINLIRELLKDIEDLEGDLKNKIITFPGKYGIKKTQFLIITLTIILILVTFYPFIFKIYSIEYFLIVLFGVNIILVYFIKELKEETFLNKISGLSKYLKISMILGLLAIYFG
jgi:geranylgeranylglycerol-phosphate geranylgeranyltransferase